MEHRPPRLKAREALVSELSRRVHGLQSYPMSRGPRLRRWLAWLAGLGSTFLLSAAAWGLAGGQQGISKPNGGFQKQPRRPPGPPPPRRWEGGPPFQGPRYGLAK